MRFLGLTREQDNMVYVVKSVIKKNTKNLDNLQKELKRKLQARVGVLGDSALRQDESGLSNADLLLIHEKGVLSKNIPRRSILENSLKVKEKDLIKAINQITKNILKSGNYNLYNAYLKISFIMLDIVVSSFDNGGYGTWQALSQKTIDNKGREDILINTGALRNSITADVKEKK